MRIRHQFQLRDYFAWRVNSVAKSFAIIDTVDDILELIDEAIVREERHVYVLGGGANTLFAQPEYDGLVIHMDIKGIERYDEDEKYVYYRVAAGEDWVKMVDFLINHERLAGIENLAYIPGQVGAAPIQNIAAYGQVFEDVCVGVETYDLHTGDKKIYMHDECGFAYRTSIFKKEIAEGERLIVSHVLLRLQRSEGYDPTTTYFSRNESLAQELSVFGAGPYSPQQIYQSIVTIRKKKLPDVKEIGTNGSLFVNPIIRGRELKLLLEKFPELQYYPVVKMQYTALPVLHDDEFYKIAAGHIFEKIGWKDKRVGNVGTWKNHALVLCNYGTDDPRDILSTIEMMKSDFHQATGILLEPEINIVKS